MKKIVTLCFLMALVCVKGWGQTTQTFSYTGSTQTFTVPAGVTSISVKVWGAGGGGSALGPSSGGSGALVKGTISVTAGQSLIFVVGGAGTNSSSSAAGGFGGGGAAGNAGDGGSGGGYSGVFITSVTQANALAIAGGGAGGGYYNATTFGGAGGAPAGSAGGSPAGSTLYTGGSGGTTSAGGAGALFNGNSTVRSNAGSALTGGSAGTGYTFGGGGGGGGYYGGGSGYSSGSTATYSSGGGGGSSYLGSLTATTNTAGTTNNTAAGAQAPGSAETGYVAGVGNGGSSSTTTGGNGLIIITYAPAPTITSFNPTSGCATTGTVVITGTNFTGATAVKIGGTAVTSFVVNSATQITATVGSGTTGTIAVTTPGGTATSAATFTVNFPPSTLTYSSNTAIYCVSTTITNNNPSNSGGVATSYSVSPALPAGLNIDPATGVISGTPTATATAANYTVTASNSCGSTTKVVNITVMTAPVTVTYSTNPAMYCPNSLITNNTPTTTSGGAPTSYSVSPALPGGLLFNTTTGVISGTPTTATPAANYIVTATNTCGSTTVAVNITISPAAPSALTYSLNTASYCVGTTITNNTPSNAGGAPTSYSVSPALPAGLNIDPATGVISGTPTATAAAANYTVTASNNCGSTTKAINITVTAPPTSVSYTTTTSTYCTGVAIAANNPTATGGTPTSYSVSPSLPLGLSLNTTTGVITGNPTTQTATAAYTVTASNSCGSATVQLTITVNTSVSALSYTTATAIYCQNTAITPNTVSAITGSGTITYSATLPAGLSIDPNTGTISGTPTALSSATNYTVTATNGCSSTTQVLSIAVSTAPVTVTYSTNPAAYCPNVAITNNTPTTTSGGAPTSYSVSPVLPTGLSISATTGVISGTPTTQTAAANYTVTASNSCGSTTVAVNITINAPAPSALTYSANTVIYCLGTAITNNTPSNSGGVPTSYSVSPALPAGLTLSTTTGVISGTPTTVTAAANYTVTATNSCGSTTKAVNITVSTAPVTVTYSTNPAAYCPNVAITNNTPTTTSGGAPTSYSVSPALPAGLTLSTTTGVISGTPTTQTAAANYTVTATNSCGSTTVAVNVTINAPAPSTLTYSANTASYCVGTAITANTPSNSGGTPTSYSVSPALPAGLTLSTTTGVISGTPTTVTAAANYTVTATNSCGSTTKAVNITVAATPTSVTYTTTTNTYCTGVAITNNNPTVTGGAATGYTVSPALPAGLTLNTTTGVISGTPSAQTVTATYIVTASNSCGSVTIPLSITVNTSVSALAYTTTTATYCQNVAITPNTVSAITGSGTITYTVSPTLPTGLSINSANGTISGTPTALSSATNYTVTATNGCSSTTKVISIAVITAPTSVTYTTSTNTYCTGVTITANNPTVSGSVAISYSVSPALPAGLSLNTSTGVISGTPTAQTATAVYTVSATNSCGSATKQLTITVNTSVSALTYTTTPVSYCVGAVVSNAVATITGSGTITYSVSPALPAGLSINTSTGLISGTPTTASAATNYTVTATNGCSSTTSVVNITINSLPGTVTIASTPASPVCSGTIVTLSSAAVASQSTTVNSGTISVAIPDNSATGGSSALTISGVPANAIVTGISVTFNITHTYDGDLNIGIAAPNNNVLNLVNRDGGSGANFTNTVVNSTAISKVSTGSAPFTGTFAPDGATGAGTVITAFSSATYTKISTFPGLYSVPNGTWTFFARDLASGDVGTITSWSIIITYNVPPVWTPIANLYTDASATTAYTANYPVSTVYFKQTNNTNATISNTYTATTTNGSSCSSSGTATVAVTPATRIVTGPSGATQNKCEGTTVSFSVSATGDNLTYQWHSTTSTTIDTTNDPKVPDANGGNLSTVSPVVTSGTHYYYAVVYGTCGTVISGISGAVNSLAITIDPFPANQTPQTVCQNASVVTLEPTVVGSNVRYQWYSNTVSSTTGGTIIPGATSFDYTPPTTAAGIFYYYLVAKSSACNSAIDTSGIAMITVNPATVINTQPSIAPQIVCQNTPATQLSVGAVGTGLGYQWYSSTSSDGTANQTLISGATLSTYTPSTATTGTLYYYVVVTGTCSPLSVTSNVSGGVTVNPLPAATISGTTTVCQNDAQPAITFTGSNGTAPYTFTYKVNGGGTQAVSTTSGNSVTVLQATGTAGIFTYTLLSVHDNSTTQCSNAASGSAAITVNPATVITTNPSGATYCQSGTAAALSVAATSTGTLTYQWFSNTTNSNSGGTLVSTGSSYTPSTASAGTFYYYVTVTGGCGSATSSVATITVNPATVITTNPSGATYCQNTTDTALTVGATGTGTFTYQWYSNTTNSNSGGTLVSTSSTYTPSTTNVGTFYYYVTVTGGCGNATSSVATVTVNPLPTATVVADNPYTCDNSGGSFTITGTPNSTVYYSLSSGSSSSKTLDASGKATVPVGFISGSSLTITLTSASASLTGCTSTLSGAGSTATITVATLPAAQDLTGGGNYCQGGNGVPVGLNGSQSGVNYQLLVTNGTTTTPVGSPVAGTGAALSFGNQTTTGIYSVQATNTTTGCQKIGGGQAVTVGYYAPTSISSITPATQSVCQNSTPADLSVTALGDNLSYQWFSTTTNTNTGGTPVGISSSTYTPVTTTPGTLYYHVVVTGTCGSVTSSTLSVTVNLLPDATISASHSVCAGSGSGVVISSVSGGTVYYHTSTNATEQQVVVPANGGSPLSDQPVETTVYTLDSVKGSTGCITILSNVTSTVTVTPLAPLTLTSGTGTDNQVVCKNGPITTITYTTTSPGVITVSNAGSLTVTGNSTSTVSISGTTAANVAYTVTTSGTSCPATANGIITIQTAAIWTGSTSTDWSIPDNWCSGTLPADGADITIPAIVPHYPVLPTGTTIVGSLTLNSGSTLTIAAGNTLQVNGDISGTGTITGSSSSNLTTGGTGTVNFTTGSNVLKRLSVTGGTLTLGNALDITSGTSPNTYGIVTVSGSGQLKTGGNLTLKSDINGTAAVGAYTGTSHPTDYILGAVTAEQYTDAGTNGVGKRAWRLMTSPVTGQTISQAWQEGLVYDATNPTAQPGTYGTIITGEKLSPGTGTGSASSLGYDYIGGGNSASIKHYVIGTSTNSWQPLPTGAGTNNTLVRAEQAYLLFIRGDRTKNTTTAKGPDNLRAAGTLIQGDQTISLTPNSTYTLVGNPFASTINFASIYSNNASINNQFYLWSSKYGTYGAYVLVAPGGNGYEATPDPLTTTTGTLPGDTYQYIPSGIGFFVSPVNVSATPGSLTIRETDKTAGNTPPVNPFRVVQTTNVRQLLVNLNLKDSDTSATLADGFRAKFSDDFIGNETESSSIKAANLNENLGLVRNSTDLIIESRADVAKTDTLYMKLWNVTRRNYQFQVKADNFTTAPGIRAWLTDSYLGTKQELSLKGDITTISFSVTADSLSSRSDRFMIVFQNNAVVLPVTLTSIKAAPQNGGVTVSWTVTNEVNIKGYTIEKSADGGTTYSSIAAQAAKNNSGAAVTSYQGFDAQPQVGDNLYRIRIEAKDGTVSYSSTVKVMIGAGDSRIEITLYPNPVRDGKVSLQLKNLKEGTYLVRVYSEGGQSVYQRKITITQPNTTQSEELKLGNGLAQGSYQLRLTDHNGAVVFQSQLFVGR